MKYPELDRIENGYYIYVYGRQEKFIKFAYAFDKAVKIANDLNRLGLNIELPSAANIGEAAGYEDFRRVNDEMVMYCEMWEVELTCLLNPQFIGFEGQKVKCINENDEIRTFYVARWGKYAPYHVKRNKPGGKGGKKLDEQFKVITPMHIKAVKRRRKK